MKKFLKAKNGVALFIVVAFAISLFGANFAWAGECRCGPGFIMVPPSLEQPDERACCEACLPSPHSFDDIVIDCDTILGTSPPPPAGGTPSVDLGRCTCVYSLEPGNVMQCESWCDSMGFDTDLNLADVCGCTLRLDNMLEYDCDDKTGELVSLTPPEWGITKDSVCDWQVTRETTESTPAEPAETAPTKIKLEAPITETSAPKIIGNIIKTLLTIVGALALGMFVYGGFTWLTSGGSPDRVKKGRDILVWAVIGMTVIFGSYTLVDFLLRSFGL